MYFLIPPITYYVFSSGCDGNLNNFNTIQECENVCDILIQMARQISEIEEKTNMEIKKKGNIIKELEE